MAIAFPRVISPKVVIAILVILIVVHTSMVMMLPIHQARNDMSPLQVELKQSRSYKSIDGVSSVSSIPSNHVVTNRTMIFVHVGKTGGETIKWRLSVICNMRASLRKKARCFEQFQERGESQVSKHTIGYMHCNALRPKHSIQNATTFMVSVRDPIDRIVSWFQYMHVSSFFQQNWRWSSVH